MHLSTPSPHAPRCRRTTLRAAVVLALCIGGLAVTETSASAYPTCSLADKNAPDIEQVGWPMYLCIEGWGEVPYFSVHPGAGWTGTKSSWPGHLEIAWSTTGTKCDKHLVNSPTVHISPLKPTYSSPYYSSPGDHGHGFFCVRWWWSYNNGASWDKTTSYFYL